MKRSIPKGAMITYTVLAPFIFILFLETTTLRVYVYILFLFHQ